jgi:hypothetical protein
MTEKIWDLWASTTHTSFAGAKIFQILADAFLWAMKKNSDQVSESFYEFAGHPVCIRIIGRELAEHLLLPFSHLRIHGPVPLTPQLTIDLWDETATGIRCRTDAPEGVLQAIEVSATSADGRFFGHHSPNTVTCFDRQAQRIIGSVAWGETVYLYERGKPLTRPLIAWYSDRNVQVIHGGLVSQDGQGIFFGGWSGSGKSTSALACLHDGFDYLGEDCVGLQKLSDSTFMGYSIYNSAFLETPHLARFPALAPYVQQARFPSEDKSFVLLCQVFPERLKNSVPIGVVVLPRVIDLSESRIRPALKAKALLTLGPSTLLGLPGLGSRRLDILARLVEQLPCYWLDLGRDLGSIPRCVKEIVAQTSHHKASGNLPHSSHPE